MAVHSVAIIKGLKTKWKPLRNKTQIKQILQEDNAN